jgi:hypothetical protein
MAKNKRPFSSFLENPDTNKAVQEALHAPAQLPAQEASTPVAVSAPVQQSVPVAEPIESKTGRPEPEKKAEKEESEPYQVVTIRKSVHRLLKMASVHYDIEIRELATEAIAAHPKIKEMLEKYV